LVAFTVLTSMEQYDLHVIEIKDVVYSANEAQRLKAACGAVGHFN
jgi:hypothetical protein